MNTILLFLEKRGLLIAALLWVAHLLFLGFHLGVKEGADSYLYLRIAQDGHFGDPYVDAHYQWYRSYILFLSLIHKIGLGWWAAIILQVILASSGLWALYDFTRRIGSERAASWTLLLYVVWNDSHIWHFYLYSDSLFVSCSLWCVWYFCHFKKTQSLLYILPFVLFTAFIRPPGIVLLFVYCVVLIYSIPIVLFWKGAIAIVGIMGLVWLTQAMLPTFEIMEVYKKGEVIYAYPEWNVTTPKGGIDPNAKNDLQHIFLFAWDHLGYFVQLFLNKAAAYLAHVKPFYSLYHNLFIVLLLFPSYSLFISGWKYWQVNAARWWVLSWMLGHLLLVAMTAEDWDGRFLLPIAPFIFAGAGIGWTSFKTSKLIALSED